MAGIRVKLQFQDAEKYWIFVDYTRMKTVQDVVNSINEKFLVNCEKLLLEDAQLPWSESVSLIKETDLLIAQIKSRKKKRKAEELTTEAEIIKSIEISEPQQHSKKKKKSKETLDERVTNLQPEYQENVPKEKKKRHSKVPQTVETTNNIIQVEDASKIVMISHAACSDSVNIKEQHINKSGQVEEHQELLSTSKSYIDVDNNQTLDSNKIEPNEDENTKRRRRRRKRKSNYKEDVKPSVYVPPAPVDYAPPHSANRLHIRFDGIEEVKPDSKQVANADQLSNSTEVTKSEEPIQMFPDNEFNPFYEGLPNCTKSSPLKSRSKSPSEGIKQAIPVKPKPSGNVRTPKHIHQQPNGSPQTSQFEALLSLRSAVFTRNTKNLTNSTTPSYNNVPPPLPVEAASSLSTQPSQKPEELSTDAGANVEQLDFTKFPLFKGPPRIDDVIAFKILELSDNYNPEVSEYIRGQIKAIQANGEMRIEFLEPRAKRHAYGKFELFENEEEDLGEAEEVEVETSMCCQWHQLIEPRLIYP